MQANVRVKIPKHINFKEFKAEFNNELNLVGDGVITDFEKTTRTWNDKPKFAKKISSQENSILLKVGTDSVIYKYLNYGTKVRYAVMTKNFIAKTTPGVIGSKTGRGGLLVINKRYPRPGIKARNFKKVLIKRWQPVYVRRMKKVIAKALKSGTNGGNK